MKMVVASDIHGSAWACRKLLEAFDREGAGRLLLLGDILYHGPRNDLPRDYAPKEVLAMLNARKERLLCVRGNCDTEVDKRVLEFPILADYMVLPMADGLIYATHGHHFSPQHFPPFCNGDVLLYGHTHIWQAETVRDHICLNPGSVAIPKGGNLPTYGVLEGGMFSVRTMDGAVVGQIALERQTPYGTDEERMRLCRDGN